MECVGLEVLSVPAGVTASNVGWAWPGRESSAPASWQIFYDANGPHKVLGQAQQ